MSRCKRSFRTSRSFSKAYFPFFFPTATRTRQKYSSRARARFSSTPRQASESAKSFLTIIDDKSKIMELLEKEEPDIEFSIKIGKEETKGMDNAPW